LQAVEAAGGLSQQAVAVQVACEDLVSSNFQQAVFLSQLVAEEQLG
jgi:hypothetical protein